MQGQRSNPCLEVVFLQKGAGRDGVGEGRLGGAVPSLGGVCFPSGAWWETWIPLFSKRAKQGVGDTYRKVLLGLETSSSWSTLHTIFRAEPGQATDGAKREQCS